MQMLGKPETPASPKQLRLNFENFFSRHFASRRVTAASPSRTQKFAFPLCASRCRALGLGAHDPVHRSHMQDRFAWRTACSRNLRQPVDRAYSCNHSASTVPKRQRVSASPLCFCPRPASRTCQPDMLAGHLQDSSPALKRQTNPLLAPLQSGLNLCQPRHCRCRSCFTCPSHWTAVFRVGPRRLLPRLDRNIA